MGLPAAQIDNREETDKQNRDHSTEEAFSRVPPQERVLLLPHCMKNSKTCQAESTADGLECVGCDPECQVNRLRGEALRLGYGGVCIAPGGSLALKFVQEQKPRAIAAVACPKELIEGVDNVKELTDEEREAMPPIVIVPLIKEGCVDTRVDMEEAIEKISIGCG